MASGDYKKDDRLLDDNRTDSGLVDSYRSITLKDADGSCGGKPAGGEDKFCSGSASADERLDSAYGSSSLTFDDSPLVKDCSVSSTASSSSSSTAAGDEAVTGLSEQEENFLTTITEDGDTSPHYFCPASSDPISVIDSIKLRSLGNGVILPAALPRLRHQLRQGILHLAIIHDDEHFAHQLIEWFPTDILDIQNNLYQTPLHLATYLSLPWAVQSLVEKGASLELQDRDGNTPLHVACQHGWVDCAAGMTRDVSPDKLAPVLETQNWKGLTCLHVATLNGHHHLVKLLMKKGADLNIQEGTSGKTALHLAVERHDVRLVALLLKQSADVDAAMFNGCTPLHLAVGRQDAAVAHLLCQADADRMVRNTEDETPLDLADGNDDILALFPFDDIQISGRSVVGMF